MIMELVKRVVVLNSTVSEFRAENDSLMSQIFLIQQSQQFATAAEQDPVDPIAQEQALSIQ